MSGIVSPRSAKIAQPLNDQRPQSRSNWGRLKEVLVLDPPTANLHSTWEVLRHRQSQMRGVPQAPPPEAAGWRQRDTAIDVERDPGEVSRFPSEYTCTSPSIIPEI